MKVLLQLLRHVADRIEAAVVNVELTTTPPYFEDTLVDNWQTIKHVQYNRLDKLGDGIEGNFVYRDLLDDSFTVREKLARKEVDLFIKTENH